MELPAAREAGPLVAQMRGTGSGCARSALSPNNSGLGFIGLMVQGLGV